MHCNINGKSYKLVEISNTVQQQTIGPKKTITINISKDIAGFPVCDPRYCDPIPPDIKEFNNGIVINLLDVEDGTRDPVEHDPNDRNPNPESPPERDTTPGSSGSGNSSPGSSGSESSSPGGPGGIGHQSIVINYYS
ncbi:hypothetical protein ACLOF6_27610 [Bacillus sp. AF53]|uniref:hypothetical protein n=1 Tax=Bacillus sp. AF53 TaxID=3158958 RepID=UPI003990249D